MEGKNGTRRAAEARISVTREDAKFVIPMDLVFEADDENMCKSREGGSAAINPDEDVEESAAVLLCAANDDAGWDGGCFFLLF